MNRLDVVLEMVYQTCPVCLLRGRLPAKYCGQKVRCKRCLGDFKVPAQRSPLGISWPVIAPAAGSARPRARTLGVAGPAAEERATPLLRVYAG